MGMSERQMLTLKAFRILQTGAVSGTGNEELQKLHKFVTFPLHSRNLQIFVMYEPHSICTSSAR